MSRLNQGVHRSSGTWARWTLLLIPGIWLLARLQVEQAWFAQFELAHLYNQRLGYQLMGGALSLLLVCVCAIWRHHWMRAYVPTPQGDIPKQRGRTYTLSLLACFTVLLSVLAVSTRLAWLAWTDPTHLGSWWSVPFDPGWPALSFSILLLLLVTLGLTRIRRLGLAFLYGSVCVCLVSARSWALWVLAIAIPNSGRIESVLGADLSFGLGRFSALALALELLLILLLLTLSTSLWSRLTRSPCLSDWGFPGWNPRERRLLRPAFALLILILAALMWLSRHQLLWLESGLVAGAGWVDVHLVLPMRTGVCVAACAAGNGFRALAQHHSAVSQTVEDHVFWSRLLGADH